MVVLEVIGSKGENARAGVVLLPIVYALPTLPSLQGYNASLQMFAFAFTFKSASTIRPGRGGTSHLTDFDETWPVWRGPPKTTSL